MAERKALVRFETTGDGQVRDAINRTADEAEKASKRTTATAEKMGKALGIALAAGAGTAALLIKRSIDAGDALYNMSQRTGIAVESLSRLDAVARLSDTSIEAIQKGVQRLGVMQLEAARGGKEQVAMLQALGLSVEEFDNLSPEEVLMRVSDAIAGIEDPAKRAAVAAKVFGKELGPELIPLLSQGSVEIKRLTELSDRLGFTMSEETAKGAAAFKNELNLLGMGIDGIFNRVAGDLLPSMTDLAAKFNDPAFREGIETIITGAATAAIKVAELTAGLGNLVREAGEAAARSIEGPGLQDLKGIEAEIRGIEDRLEQRKKNPGRVGLFAATTEELEAQLTALRQQREVALDLAKFQEGLVANQPDPAKPASTDPKQPDAAALLIEQAERERKLAEERRAGAEAARAKAEAERELQRLLEEQQGAAAEFQATLEDLSAAAGGPVAQAYLDYQREVIRINELHELGKISTEDLARALALLTEQRDREVEALQNRLTPAQEVLAQLREELDLLGMTRKERDKYFARQAMGEGATPEEQAEADRLIEDRERAGSLADGMDFLRVQGMNLLEDWSSGTKSWGDAVEDVLDNLRARLLKMAAEKLIEMAFGEMGTTSTGSVGGNAFGWLGQLFGGGSAKGNAFLSGNDVEAFALGGIPDGPKMFPMARGRWGVMNEELDQEAIVPLKRGADGRLGVQMTGGGGAGDVHIGQIVLQAETDRSSAGQRSQELGLKIQRELARSGR